MATCPSCGYSIPWYPDALFPSGAEIDPTRNPTRPLWLTLVAAVVLAGANRYSGRWYTSGVVERYICKKCGKGLLETRNGVQWTPLFLLPGPFMTITLTYYLIAQTNITRYVGAWLLVPVLVFLLMLELVAADIFCWKFIIRLIAKE